MRDLFFYGTLRHVPLLELVLDRGAERITRVEATLPGHRVDAVAGQPFPTIAADPVQVVEGLLLPGLSETDIDRLIFYEGGFSYGLSTHTVTLNGGRSAQAEVFFPEPGLWQSNGHWSLDRWVAEWGDISLHAAREVMASFGVRSAQQMARSFPAIRMRAAARLAAEARPPEPGHDATRDVVVERHERAYVNYFGVDEMDLRHRRYDGTMSEPLARSALMQGQASVVLPYDPERDRVLLVEQFRAPVYMIGDPAPWMWEPVAGMIDPGETPEQAACREAEEEAQITLQSLISAGRAYSSSGSSTEYLHLFVGLTDLSSAARDGGVADEGEDIRSRIVPFAQLMEEVDAHVIKDLPLLSIANWLARHRESLRAEAR